MGLYAEIQNSTITNAIEADAAFAQANGYVLMPVGAGIGWTTPDGGTTWVVPPLPLDEQNHLTLQQRAHNALTNNETFLAITSPTAAQAIAQVQALTRQVNALIRLHLGLLDSITDA